MTPIQRAIKEAGGAKAVAEAFGIERQAVERWGKRNRLPADRVLKFEEITGLSRHDLRPDIYPRDAA